MSRRTCFAPRHEPFVAQDGLELKDGHTHGPFPFLNPTRAHFRKTAPEKDKATATATSDEEDGPKTEQVADNVGFKWRSRDNRKGRHALMVEPATDPAKAKYVTPLPSNSPQEILKGIRRMFTKFPVWDVSYLVATIFTLGSVVWCINAFFVWLPLVRPSTLFNKEVSSGGGITAFIGATIFEFGSWLLMIEAVNENQSGCFGWALSQVIEEHSGVKRRVVRLTPDSDGCAHHHTNKKNFVGKGTTTGQGEVSDGSTPPSDERTDPCKEEEPKSFVWFPSWHELATHYLHEIGFLACLSQLLGATIFWIAGFTALPGALNQQNQKLLDGAYWAPQVIGGTGFIVSGTLFMLETQEKWYKPAFGVLGWHIGAWNLVGGIGFTLSGALGFSTKSGAEYESALATFWGSWAFLIGSTLQWYESLEKHPVEEAKEPIDSSHTKDSDKLDASKESKESKDSKPDTPQEV